MSSDDYEEYDSDGPSDWSDEDDYSEDEQDSRKRRIYHVSGPSRKKQRDSGITGIYVLRNPRTGSCYVGKSNNVQNRLLQHQDATQERLVQERPLTTGSTGDLESWERNEVLTRMYRHGLDSVRGWRYTHRGSLTPEERLSARNDIMEKFDLCRRCGRNSHFADSCFARTPAEWCKNMPMG